MKRTQTSTGDKSLIDQLKIAAETLTFIFAWVGVTSFIVANFNLQGDDIKQAESTERFWYLFLFITSCIILYFTLMAKMSSFTSSIVLNLIGLITVITGLTNWVGDPAWHTKLWLGFEWPYLIIFALVYFIITIGVIFKVPLNGKIMKTFLYFLLSYSICSFILTALQDDKSIPDKYSYSFVNNELLGPSSGKFPFVNFHYQYGALQGFLIAPIKYFDSSFFTRNTNQITAFSLSLFAMATALMGANLIKKISGTSNNLVALGIACGWLNFAQFNQTGSQGSLLSPQTSVQIRLFSIFLVIICLNKAFTYLENHRFILGGLFFFLAFLSATNNQDFGLISFGSMLFLKFFYSKNRFWYTFTIGLLTILSFFLLVLMLRLISGQWISTEYILFFQRNYSSSFIASIPIDYAGPVLIVVPFLFAGFFIPIIVRRSYRLSEKNYLIPQAIALSGILAFPYFLNRSIASTQLQIFIPIAFLSLLPTLKHIITFASLSKIGVGSRVALNPFLILLTSIALSLIVFSSKPINQIDRIFSSETRSSKGFLYSVITEEDLSAIKKSGLHYFGENANMVSLMTGAKTLNIFNQTGDVVISPKALELQCKVFKDLNIRQIVSNWDSLDIVYKKSSGGVFPNSFCSLEVENANIYESTFSIIRVKYE
jgi:hypothetical protein